LKETLVADQDWRSVISDDGQAAVITIPQGATEEATIVFNSVDDLDRLIQMISVLRAQMAPAVPTTPRDTDIPMSTNSPIWTALARRQDGKRPLLIRHPGLGWIGFLFNDDSAAVLAASLTSPSVA
jgi:hypothetical protein